MLLLGIDIGTSSVKVSVVDVHTQKKVAATSWPEQEAPILSLQTGWAEQSPASWWKYTQEAIRKLHATHQYHPKNIVAIGIAYQMHGLVLVNKEQQLLRDSIIWCDSRAVAIGEEAFQSIGKEKALHSLLNSPGNFTASKLAWVKANEPHIYEQVAHMMLPGDYIAMQLTGDVTTSISALSEGIFWDFSTGAPSVDVMQHFGFSPDILPPVQPVFSLHGVLSNHVAQALGLTAGIPVSYKAGDQPNNALSLNVLEPGEVAATAGTSGVVYAVSEQLTYDPQSRVNSFAHVNHTNTHQRIGVLLCINGTGILNRWLKTSTQAENYAAMNAAAASIEAGSNGLQFFPFGNGAERMLNNSMPGASITGLDLNTHTQAHLYRAGQEGIAYAFKYGFDILKESNLQPTVIRAGKANMFLSEVFAQCFVNTLQVPVELYDTDGSVGAAIGAGIGAGIFADAKEAFANHTPVHTIVPDGDAQWYAEFYAMWKEKLQQQLK